MPQSAKPEEAPAEEAPAEEHPEMLDGEQARLRDMLRREQARSDLLWELAIRRGLVSLEDETMHEGAQDRNGR